MQTFAAKPKVTQQAASPKATERTRSHFGHSHKVPSILHLQRTDGNQEVQGLLQPKSKNFQASSDIKRAMCCNHDFSCLLTRASSRASLQPKLKVNNAGDMYEQEADRVAEQVMLASEPAVQGTCTNSSTYLGYRKAITPVVQRKTEATNAARPVGSEGFASMEATTAIRGLGNGVPLAADDRAFFEGRFGHSFSDVRIHSGSRADTAAKSLQARAFTHGASIAFAQGEYRPGTEKGRYLIAHELTHILQQRGRPEVMIQRALPSVSGRSFRNTGETDSENNCSICPKPLGVAAGDQTRNRMEWQFTLAGHRPEVQYNILRKKWSTHWEKTSAGAWRIFRTDPSGSFDDRTNNDEDLSPENNHIYSIDGPGFDKANGSSGWHPRGSTPGSTEIVQNVNFVEWVKAKDPSTGEGWSTISDLAFWHTKLWLMKDSSGKWNVAKEQSEIDTGSLSRDAFTKTP